jgi:hypothetical protein
VTPLGLLEHAEPAFRAASGASSDPGWVVRVAVVLGAAGVGVALSALGLDPRDRRAVIVVALVAVATRLFLPDTFLQVDADDLREVAIARGIDVSAFGGTANPPPELVAVLRMFVPFVGDSLGAVFLPMRAAGVLLPIAGHAVARRWLARPDAALAAGLVLAASPVAIAFSSAISAELPAALLYACALGCGLAAGSGRAEGRPASAALVLPAALALVVAVALKDELVALVPAYALTVGVAAWQRSDRGAMALAAIPAAAALAVHLAWGSTGPAQLSAWRVHVLSPAHVAAYLVCVALLNPPFLPTKLAIALGLRSGAARRDAPLVAHAALFLAMFASAYQPVGFNQWRYSLDWLLPAAILAAPAALAAWEARQRLLAVLCLLELGAGLAWYANAAAGSRNADLRAVRAWEPGGPSLLVYGAYRQDRDPGLVIALDGRYDSAPLAGLWPPTCAPAVEQRRIAVATEYRDLVVKAGLDRARFRSIDSFDADREWLAAHPVDPALAVRPDRSDVGPALDPEACARDLPAWRERLAGYYRIGLLVDSDRVASLRTESLLSKLPIEAPTTNSRVEFLDRAARWLVLDGGLASVRVVPVTAVMDPLDPSGPPLWGAR